jgi:Rhodopirellula transposase DDE domain
MFRALLGLAVRLQAVAERKGGGRRDLSSRDTTLIKDLRNVIEPATLGDPMRPLLWVSKSYDKLASALQKKGHEISASSLKRLLADVMPARIPPQRHPRNPIALSQITTGRPSAIRFTCCDGCPKSERSRASVTVSIAGP